MGIVLDIDDVAASSETAKKELAELRTQLAQLQQENAQFRLALEQSKLQVDLFKKACWLHTRHIIGRYLMSNAHDRWDGVEKAIRHMELCQFYVGVVKGYTDPDMVKPGINPYYQKVHSKTQELTDHLDEKIGFPLTERPDYDRLEPLFFNQFHALAMAALS